MLDPRALLRFEADATAQDLRPGPLVIAMGAFIDAGATARLLGEHLTGSSTARVLCSFDIDQVLDYRGRRPAMVFETNRWTAYDDPSLLLYAMEDRDGSPYYLLVGPEPDYQWERMVDAVRFLVDALKITLVVHAHGIPMAVPHTRPVGITAHATDPRLIAGAESPFGTVQVPASFTSLLEYRLGEQGRDAIGYAVHVPHYLAQSEFAEGALTALNAIVDSTGLNLPNDELVEAAGLNRAQIAQEVAGNDEVGHVITALEKQYDAFVEGRQRPSLLATESSDLPSADELGAEFEQFLRGVGDHDQDGPGSP
ncbi:proteasome assembly chaperone family protein [Nostocoides sp. F2B08]|uniref:proteasome assembly chaperone family protein n=1 Tax=Nostocoides sp. F2B08 TaxID=2653936 RepID=UPI00186B4380|nr:PAC2 family protein [Tetrasphaera sp. F2B08]